MKALLTLWFARLPALLRALGPYAAIELLLPGGSIIALLFWLYRRRANIEARTWSPRALAPAAAVISEFIAIPTHLSLPSLNTHSLDYFTSSNRQIRRRQ